jgi:hypothetical protein
MVITIISIFSTCVILAAIIYNMTPQSKARHAIRNYVRSVHAYANKVPEDKRSTFLFAAELQLKTILGIYTAVDVPYELSKVDITSLLD